MGPLGVIDCFQKVLDLANVELEHNMMGCGYCWINGDVMYCAQSWYNPPWQNCYHLTPKFDGPSEYLDHTCVNRILYLYLALVLDK